MQTKSAAKPGVLLVNLGTPDSPRPRDVARYLREFLMDPLVIDIPFLARWVLVNGVIAPFRSRSSGKLYETIWTEAGSPLLVFHRALGEAFEQKFGEDYHVEIAMRYGKPSIQAGLNSLIKKGANRLIVAALYPQYSLAATESTHREVRRVAAKAPWKVPLTFVDPFYQEPAFIDAFAHQVRPFLKDEPDWVLFSFHGLPERQVKKTDPSGQHCFASSSCCDTIGNRNQYCYRAHSFATARAIAEKLDIHPESWGVGFQSRLGREPWIRPYTDEWYDLLPKQGVKKLLVVCPAFVADCLETLEEIRVRGQEAFEKAGGESVTLVPSLNAEPKWVQALGDMVRRTDEQLVNGLAHRPLPNQASGHGSTRDPDQPHQPEQ